MGWGFRPVAASSGVWEYQPAVEVTVWPSPTGMSTTSSMGYGNFQCRPGLSNCSAPTPTGFPRRSLTATWFGLTVNTPEKMNAATSAPIRNLTMVEVLRSASDKACAPASSSPRGGSGTSGGFGAGAASAGAGLESGWEGSLAIVWNLSRGCTATVVRCAVQ